MTLGTNWAGSYAYRARELHRPATIAQLQEIAARAPRVRMLGSRHTFSLSRPAHLYERREDFVALAERLDPRGAFRNAWLERVALDSGAA
jgi:hypothetical protein